MKQVTREKFNDTISNPSHSFLTVTVAQFTYLQYFGLLHSPDNHAQKHLFARLHIFLDSHDNTAISNTQTLRIPTSGYVHVNRAGLATTE